MMDEQLLLTDTPRSEAEDILFATAADVNNEGVRLIFPGEDAASEKRYKGNVGADIRRGDRVKLSKDSGTYVIDYTLGVPGSRLAGGGSEIPTGGSADQILAKNSSADYDVKWVDAPPNYIPAGGTDGQFLAKDGSRNYMLKWVTAAGSAIPSGGTTGQVLTKKSNSNGDLEWKSLSTDRLGSGSYYIEMSGSTITASGGDTINLGTSTRAFNNIYANGTIVLCNKYNAQLTLGGSGAKIGFFGKTPVAKQSLYSSATLANVISLLQNYGLA